MPSMGGSATLISAPHLGDLLDVDMSAKVDQSIPSWQAGAGKYEPLPGVTGDGDTGVVVTGQLNAGISAPAELQFHTIKGEMDVLAGQTVLAGGGSAINGDIAGVLAGNASAKAGEFSRSLTRGGHSVTAALFSTIDNGDGGGAGLVGLGEVQFQTLVAGIGAGLVVNAAGGVSAFGATPPTVQPAITGALSTVADAPAKAVLTSIIAALVGCGLASDGTT